MVPRSRKHRVGSTLRRPASWLAAALACVLLVAGCGDQGDSRAREGDRGGGGTSPDSALAWLPASTWLVATGDLSDERIDRAIGSLRRIPSWAYLEGELAASDGPGVRDVLAGWAATRLSIDGTIRVDQLGSQGGIAVVDDDLARVRDPRPSVVAWLEVDDEAAARSELRAVLGDRGDARSWHGTGYAMDPARGIAWRVDDGLLLVASSESVMRDLVDAHRDRDTLAQVDAARAVLDSVQPGSIAAVAVATDPVLAWQRRTASDAAVPDWVAGSATIDDVGVVLRGAWSNPRELDEPDPTARARVEAAPDTSGVAAAAPVSSDSTGAVMLVRELAPAAIDALDGAVAQLLGVDRGAPARGRSLRIRVDDGVALLTLPAPAGRAAGAGAGTIGDLPAYVDAVEAADPPASTGAWAWVDLPRLVDGSLAAWAAGSSTRTRALPVVRANLRALPGFVAWTDRDQSDDERIGVARAVLPIG